MKEIEDVGITSPARTGFEELAPDGSEIRPLLRTGGASLGLCRLAPGRVSRAIRHRTVEELWYVLGGTGRVWRKHGEVEEVTSVNAGAALAIAREASFQFRASGNGPLTFLTATVPAWPGPDEAVEVPGIWRANVSTVPAGDPFEADAVPASPSGEPDAVAADGSEVRRLCSVAAASAELRTLHAKRVSYAARNTRSEEMWYVADGSGEIWRRKKSTETSAPPISVRPGDSLTIPTNVHFQFRSLGELPMTFFCVTMPPWAPEATERIADAFWPVSL